MRRARNNARVIELVFSIDATETMGLLFHTYNKQAFREAVAVLAAAEDRIENGEVGREIKPWINFKRMIGRKYLSFLFVQHINKIEKKTICQRAVN